MKTITLTCNQCGESLEVPEETRFLTCTACSSQLEVQRSGSTAYTEVLEAVEPVKLELELEKLDREWVEEKERHGSVRILELVVFVMWLAMISGLVLIQYGVAVDMAHLGGPGPGPVPYVCMFLGTFLVVGWLVFFIFGRGNRCRIGAYYQAKQSYDYRRQKLIQDIEDSGERDEEQSAEP